jgi:pyruvyl transferase EpsO
MSETRGGTMNISGRVAGGSIDTNLRLYELKENLGEVAKCFPDARRVIYFDYPVQLNVGDLLINVGTEEFFREHKIDIWKRYYVFDFPANIKGMDDDVVIACHGGGNFGDVWPIYQQQREALLARYPRNRFVFLPQTCYFSSQPAFEESMSKLRQHKDLHIFVRDFMSKQRLESARVPNVTMMPDMAHMLLGVLKPKADRVVEGGLQLLRTDRESAASGDSEGGSVQGKPTVDWQNVVSWKNAQLAKLVWKSMTLHRKTGLPGEKTRRWYWIRDRLIGDAVSVFSRYDYVYTDRLHGMIFGLLLGRNVHVKDNSYGKVSTYYRTWLQGVDRISLE